MIVVDSSAWIELLADGPLASAVRRELARAKRVFVPTLVLFEVYRKLLRTISESDALKAIVVLSQHAVIDLSRDIALLAGDISVAEDLPMADSVVLATARSCGALLVTLDNDFAGLGSAKVLR